MDLGETGKAVFWVVICDFSKYCMDAVIGLCAFSTEDKNPMWFASCFKGLPIDFLQSGLELLNVY